MRLLLLALLLVGCAKPKQESESVLVSASFIQKTGVLFPNMMEGTPVVWNNQLIYVVSNRIAGDSIDFYNNQVVIASYKTTNHLISAIVHNNALYLFGTSGNTIEMVMTNDLISWTASQTVITAPQGTSLHNSSVSTDSTGFIMAYETCEPNTTCFNARFAHSTDLVNWSSVGTIFKPDIYAACPTIRFSNGYYYVFYLKSVNHFATFVTRSRDLVNWEEDRIVLSSQDNGVEGSNNSDMDFVEFNGQVLIEYASGNQSSGSDAWANINGAVFNGTQDQFLETLFN